MTYHSATNQPKVKPEELLGDRSAETDGSRPVVSFNEPYGFCCCSLCGSYHEFNCDCTDPNFKEHLQKCGWTIDGRFHMCPQCCQKEFEEANFMDTARYYWMVKTLDAEIHLHADSVETTPTGGLVFWKQDEAGHNRFQILAIPEGRWEYFHAASVFDGSAIGLIEHWVIKEGK